MQEILDVSAGYIFAILGFECSTGDTFTDNVPVTMESIHVPEPIMNISIKPKKFDNISKFIKSVQRFQREDPIFRISKNEE